jgi:hypothetical protein
MTVNQVRAAMHTQPFRPFTVQLAGGRSYLVRYPDFISVDEAGRDMVIHDAEGIHLIEMPLVVEIIIPPAAAVPGGNGE